MSRRWIITLLASTTMLAPLHAVGGSRLLATGGITQIEGAAGGGLVPWAFIAGLEAANETGASVFCSQVDPQDFRLRSCGIAIGLSNRAELSFARQTLQIGESPPGTSIHLDIVGAKVRVAGDAIFERSPWLPQIALGIQYKKNRDAWLPRMVGAKDESIDVYLAATKLYLDGFLGRSLLLNATLRATQANQFGLLGFGSASGSHTLQPELSAAVFVADSLATGVEYRFKPNNLADLREDDFKDVFVAWFPHKAVAVSVAYVDLGSVAGRRNQRGLFGSLQLAF